MKQNPVACESKKEFFLDDDGVLYRRRSSGDHQLIVPETLVHGAIKQNHDPVYLDTRVLRELLT